MGSFDHDRQIAIIWGIEDVKNVRPDLSDEQAVVVLQHVKRHHDAERGVTWDVLKNQADLLYPH